MLLLTIGTNLILYIYTISSNLIDCLPHHLVSRYVFNPLMKSKENIFFQNIAFNNTKKKEDTTLDMYIFKALAMAHEKFTENSISYPYIIRMWHVRIISGKKNSLHTISSTIINVIKRNQWINNI